LKKDNETLKTEKEKIEQNLKIKEKE